MGNVTNLTKKEKEMKDLERLRALFDLCKEYDVATINFQDIDVTFYKIINQPEPEQPKAPTINVDDDSDSTGVEDIISWSDIETGAKRQEDE